MSVVAANIKKYINEKGFKQKAIAEKIQMSERNFSAMLNGRKNVDCTYIVPICIALDVSPNDLFDYQR